MEVLQSEIKVSRRTVPVRDLSFLKQKVRFITVIVSGLLVFAAGFNILFDESMNVKAHIAYAVYYDNDFD